VSVKIGTSSFTSNGRALKTWKKCCLLFGAIAALKGSCGHEEKYSRVGVEFSKRACKNGRKKLRSWAENSKILAELLHYVRVVLLWRTRKKPCVHSHWQKNSFDLFKLVCNDGIGINTKPQREWHSRRPDDLAD
jgi:hypothetical protein